MCSAFYFYEPIAGQSLRCWRKVLAVVSAAQKHLLLSEPADTNSSYKVSGQCS